MRSLFAAAAMALVALTAGCNPDADFANYCSLTGNCQCSGGGCCSLSVCGDQTGLDCCPGTVCASGQCIQAAAALTLSKSEIDFGRSPDLAPTPAVAVVVTNLGNVSAPSQLTLHVSSGDESEFQVDASACPVNLAPGTACSVQIRLTPTTLGVKQATLTTAGGGAQCALSGTFGFLVQVNLSGGQLTAVQSSPPALECAGSECTAYFAGGTVLSLSVLSPYGVTWGPPCSEPTGECSFTVTADTQVAATIQPPLTVDVVLPGVPSGFVQVDPGAVACAGHCELAISQAVTLTALAQPNASANATVFQGWTGACAGSGPVCALDVVAPTEASVTLSDLNAAFLTGPVALSTFGADGAGADAACNAAAPAGSTQNYVAWVATSTRNPAQLLAASAGWSPVQAPLYAVPTIARNVSDITSARLWSPIPCEGCSGPIITGANPDGTSLSLADNCQDWTSATGTAPVGSVSDLGYAWSVDLGAARMPCSGSALLACFGTATSGVVLTVPPATLYYSSSSYGVMFLSSPWIPSGGTTSGDAHCQADALAAGLSGTFVAGSISNTPFGGSTFPNFIRSDGALLGDHFADGAQQPVNVDASGAGLVPTVLTDTYVWYASSSSNCNNWTGGPGAVGAVTRYDLSVAYQVTTEPCTAAHRLFCLQSQ
ncbi:MAG: choice-of-anchor D domain-containing protein [Myxococcaceae bacterium]